MILFLFYHQKNLLTPQFGHTNHMAWLWRAGAKLSLVASAVGGGATAALIATSDDPETALKLCATVPHRLFRDAATAANIAFGTVDLTQLPLFSKYL